jgi:hypothetical protein
MFDSDTRMLEGLFGDMMDYDYTSPVTHTEEAFDFNFNFMKMMPDMHEEYSFRDITESTTKAEDVVVGSGSGSSHPVAVSTSSQPTTTAQPTEMPIPTDDDLESCRWFNWDPFLFEDSSSLTSSTVVKEEDSISAPTTSASSPSSSTTDVEDTPIGGCIKRKRSGSCSALEEEGACRKKERADGGGVTPRIGTIKVTNPAIYATLIDGMGPCGKIFVKAKTLTRFHTNRYTSIHNNPPKNIKNNPPPNPNIIHKPFLPLLSLSLTFLPPLLSRTSHRSKSS